MALRIAEGLGEVNNEECRPSDHYLYYCPGALSLSQHRNGNIVILTKISSLAALKVVILTTSSAASDENFIKMMTFAFQLSIRKSFAYGFHLRVPDRQMSCKDLTIW